MTDSAWERTLGRFNRNEPARLESIAEFEEQSGFRLPLEYKSFLLRSNGGEGSVGDNYLMLWRVEELMDLNAGYEVAENVSGLFLFGSDGGGEAFGFKSPHETGHVVMIPFVGMDADASVSMGAHLDEFLEQLHRSPASDLIRGAET